MEEGGGNGVWNVVLLGIELHLQERMGFQWIRRAKTGEIIKHWGKRKIEKIDSQPATGTC